MLIYFFEFTGNFIYVYNYNFFIGAANRFSPGLDS